jgi:hypothetical protein
LVSSPLCGRLTRYCFLFKSLGLEFVVLSLWGALSDERPGLSFVSHSLVICLCAHLLFTVSFLCKHSKPSFYLQHRYVEVSSKLIFEFKVAGRRQWPVLPEKSFRSFTTLSTLFRVQFKERPNIYSVKVLPACRLLSTSFFTWLAFMDM